MESAGPERHRSAQRSRGSPELLWQGCADCFDTARSFGGLRSCDQQNAAIVSPVRVGKAQPDHSPIARNGGEPLITLSFQHQEIMLSTARYSRISPAGAADEFAHRRDGRPVAA
jgi:hypothetical protein